MNRSLLLTMMTSAAFFGCSSDESETNCDANDGCSNRYECVDKVCIPVKNSTDSGVDTTNKDVGVKKDISTDDVSKDVGISDVGLDVSQDTGPDVITYPAPSASTHFDLSLAFRIRDAAENGTGVVVVGTTPNDFAANESREAVAFHFDDTGLKWAIRVGDASNDQFAAAATDGTQTVLAGMSRGYSVGAANNNDVLLVEVNENGMVSASSFGTLADEFIFNIFPGGQVAKWIAVGEYINGGRDGLVIGIDANLEPMWARTFDLGGEEFLTGGVVIGDAIYVVGNTNLLGGGARKGFIARMTAAGVTWTRQTTGAAAGNAISVYASKDGTKLNVAGRIEGEPSTYTLTLAGDVVGGTIWDIPNSRVATGISFGKRKLIHGIQSNGAPFILSPDDENPTAIVLNDGLRTSQFLRTPIAKLNGEGRVLVQTNDNAIIDIPFSLTPEISCFESVETVTIKTLPANAFESVNGVLTSLTFGGGSIGNIRTSNLTVTETSDVCGP